MTWERWDSQHLRFRGFLVLAVGMLFGVLHSNMAAAGSWRAIEFSSVRGTAVQWTGRPESYLCVSDSVGFVRLLRTVDSGRTWHPYPPDPPVRYEEFLELFTQRAEGTPRNHLWVTSASGELWRLRETDTQWSDRGPPGEGPISALQFAGARNAWAARTSGTPEGSLFRTTDQGDAWMLQPTPPEAATFRKVRYFTEEIGWLLDADGKIWRADSSGFTQAPFLARAADFLSPASALAVTLQNEIQQTVDAGITWEPVASNLDAAEFQTFLEQTRDLDFQSPLRGTLLTVHGLLVTSDGGSSWELSASGDSIGGSVAHDGITLDYLLGGRQVMHSTDRGLSWRVQTRPDFSLADRTDASTLWSLDGGLLRSQDGGTTWLRLPLPLDPRGLISLEFAGPSHAWIHRRLAEGPTLYRTTDGAGSWSSGDAERKLAGLRQLRMRTEDSGYAACEDGLFATGDGGLSWTRIESFPDSTAHAVFFLGDSLGWSSGNVNLHRTTDGGLSWTSSGSEETFIDLAFVSPDTGFAAGRGLYRTADGGTTWERALLPDFDQRSGAWRSFSGVDRFQVWASGDQGRLAFIADGWNVEPYDRDLQLNSVRQDYRQVRFASAEHGVTGGPSLLLRHDPDLLGPAFQLWIAAHPYLQRYLNIFLGARERVLGDSITVTVQGERLPVTYQDPDGFLFRCLYELPSTPVGSILLVTAADLDGNLRTAQLTFRASLGPVDFPSGRTRIAVRPASSSETFGAFVGIAWRTEGAAPPRKGDFGGLPDLPPEWVPLGVPVQFLTADPEAYRHGTWSLELHRAAPEPGSDGIGVAPEPGRATLAALTAHGWREFQGPSHHLQPADLSETGEWILLPIWIAQTEPGPPPSPPLADWRLLVWPNPSRGPVQVALRALESRVQQALQGPQGGPPALRVPQTPRGPQGMRAPQGPRGSRAGGARDQGSETGWTFRLYDPVGRQLGRWTGRFEANEVRLAPEAEQKILELPAGVYWLEAQQAGDLRPRLRQAVVRLR